MDQVKLRKWQNLLIVSGSGIIIFGFWSIAKTILTMFFTSDGISDLPEDLPRDTWVIVTFFIILISMMLIDLGLRIIIWRSARSEALGKKKRWAYLILAFILFIFNLISLVTFPFSADRNDTPVNIIVAFIVDLTSLITVAQLIVAAIMVKRLTKQQKGAQ